MNIPGVDGFLRRPRTTFRRSVRRLRSGASVTTSVFMTSQTGIRGGSGRARLLQRGEALECVPGLARSTGTPEMVYDQLQ